MPEKLILKSQANEVLAAIQAAGLEPSQFAWHKRPGVRNAAVIVSHLVHEPSRYYFIFDFTDRGHWAQFSPGAEQDVEVQNPGSWPLQLQYVAQWLRNLRREAEAPDLWEAVRSEATLLAPPAPGAHGANAQFTAEEKQRIADNVEELKNYVQATYDLSANQLQLINDRLDYLTEASRRVGRKDWLVIAAGVLTNIIVGAALAPDAAKDILRFAGRILGWVVGHPPLLP